MPPGMHTCADGDRVNTHTLTWIHADTGGPHLSDDFTVDIHPLLSFVLHVK